MPWDAVTLEQHFPKILDQGMVFKDSIEGKDSKCHLRLFVVNWGENGDRGPH